MDNSASRCVQKKSDRATLAQPRSVGGCVQSRMVAADARRIMEAKPFPPRYLGGYACCDDSWTHPARSAGPGISSKLHCQGAGPPYPQPLVESAMNGNLSAFREHFRRMGAAYLVLILSLIPTVLA